MDIKPFFNIPKNPKARLFPLEVYTDYEDLFIQNFIYIRQDIIYKPIKHPISWKPEIGVSGRYIPGHSNMCTNPIDDFSRP